MRSTLGRSCLSRTIRCGHPNESDVAYTLDVRTGEEVELEPVVSPNGHHAESILKKQARR